MADVGQTSFENLNHSGIFKATSKDDKNVSISLDVWNGNPALVVFTGAGGKPWKLSLNAKKLAIIGVILKKLQKDPSPRVERIELQQFVEENGRKGMKPTGSLAIGIDETMVPFFELSANDLQGRHVFPIKGDSGFNLSNTSLNERDVLTATFDYLLQGFGLAVMIAIRMSSFKRAAGGGGGGGNRGNFGGGGGGNRNNYGGGNNGGGGGYNNRQNNGGGGGGGTFGGGPDTDNDLNV